MIEVHITGPILMKYIVSVIIQEGRNNKLKRIVYDMSPSAMEMICHVTLNQQK